MEVWEYSRDEDTSIEVEPAREGIDITIYNGTDGYHDIVIPTNEAIAMANYILRNAVPKPENKVD